MTDIQKNLRCAIAPLIFLSLACLPRIAAAHGTQYEIMKDGVVGVKAMYDSGQPMANAKTLIYAPDTTSPAFETRTDPNGIVCFHPDRPGTWVLQVRATGGHGMRVNMEIDDGMTLTAEETGIHALTSMQKLVMTACVIWGFVGTAFFFKSKKRVPS